jgi:uncharacterized protein YbaR (Trm112 family)
VLQAHLTAAECAVGRLSLLPLGAFVWWGCSPQSSADQCQRVAKVLCTFNLVLLEFLVHLLSKKLLEASTNEELKITYPVSDGIPNMIDITGN